MSYAAEFINQMLHAMDEHEILARHLIEKLLEETDQPNGQEIRTGAYYLIENDETELLSDGWRYDVHGEHCLFVNTQSGQKIEVFLGNDEMLASLDPYFFYSFLESTEKFKLLSQAFRENPFKKMCDFFDQMVVKNIMENANGVSYRKCH